MSDNDLTPLLEVCKNIKGFSEYNWPGTTHWSPPPHQYASIMMKHEYWDEYLNLAISIANSCIDAADFDKKIKQLNSDVQKEWFDWGNVYI